MTRSPAYPLLTERLSLRPLDPERDVDAVHAYQSRDDVCRYIPYHPRTRDEVAQRLRDGTIRATFEVPGHAIVVGVERRDTGTLIGDVMLAWTSGTHRSGELGYVVNPDHHGHGFATEAAAAMLDYAFDATSGLGLHRVTARIDERNAASAAVLRRLGMRQEARLVENEWFKGEWTTELDFAILAAEWRR